MDLTPEELDAWLAHVDQAEADGVDPFCAVVDADRALRRGLQASLDRD